MSERIGRYDIVETLGKGGMGVVYRARDPELDREVAIKVVLAWAQFDSDAIRRFQREARVVAGLKHPHIVMVFDAGRTEDGLPYFVMEHLEGTDLGAILEQEGALAVDRAVDYVLQMCDGLEYAHDQGIVHRDIKPANLRITPEDHLKIVDFGIAMLVGSRITGSGVSLGTPLYMAPEQVAGASIDHRADIFAVGGVLYTLLAGQPPFEGPTLGSVCYKIEKENPAPLSELGVQVSPGLQAAIDRALMKDPEQRYSSVSELAEDLENAAQPGAAAVAPTVLTPRPGTPEEESAAADEAPARPRSGSRRIATLGLLTAALLLVAGLWAWPRVRGGDAAEPERSAMAESTSRSEASAATGSEPTGESESGDRESGGTTDGRAARSQSADDEPSGGALGPERSRPGRIVPGGLRRSPEELADPSRRFYPAGTIDRAQVARFSDRFTRALQARDSAAIAELFGGTIPPGASSFLGRLMDRSRIRVRHRVLDVARSDDGMVLAEIAGDILFVGAPGRVPPPRQFHWTLLLESDHTGALTLRGIRNR